MSAENACFMSVDISLHCFCLLAIKVINHTISDINSHTSSFTHEISFLAPPNVSVAFSMFESWLVVFVKQAGTVSPLFCLFPPLPPQPFLSPPPQPSLLNERERAGFTKDPIRVGLTRISFNSGSLFLADFLPFFVSCWAEHRIEMRTQ